MILGECALQMCLYASRFTFYEVTFFDLTGKKCQPNSEPSPVMLEYSMAMIINHSQPAFLVPVFC